MSGGGKKSMEGDLFMIRDKELLAAASSRLPDAGKEWEAAEGESRAPVRFQPARVLILTKLSRFQFEQRTNPDLSQAELEEKLKKRGSDYFQLLERHKQHMSYLSTIQSELQARGIEYRVVQRWNYDREAIEWADAVFSAGGDGTFLLAASKVTSRHKPVIGINTDPESSEGYLCLMKKLPESHFKEALDRLLNGQFKWIWRSRIRVTMSGKNLDEPIELHDMQLMHPEHRWSEHVAEQEEARLRSHSAITGRRLLDEGRLRSHSSVSRSKTLEEGHKVSGQKALLNGLAEDSPKTPRRSLSSGPRSPSSSVFESPESDSAEPDVLNQHNRQRIPSPEEQSEDLPFLALNDIFIGESLSARVSYYEISLDGGPALKQKSSGLTVCTGTGSTSWYFNISKLTEQCVENLLQLTATELDRPELLGVAPGDISRLTRNFNDRLIFSPSDSRMGYAIRDPVYNATFAPLPPRGFAREVLVKSRCFDAHLVIDGGMSYIFNDGATATLSLRPEDSLRTVVFR